MKNLIGLEKWYQDQCNGDWEHHFGIKIETIDNPGWSISIDTIDTNNILDDSDWKYFEESQDDWYGYKITEGKFEGAGDPSKLNKLIAIFIELND